MRIFHKFTVLLVILMVSSSLIQFAVFDKFLISNLDDLLLSINTQAAINFSEQLSSTFKKTEISLKKIAANPEIWQSQKTLDTINEINSDIDLIAVLDTHGNFLRISGTTKMPTANLSQRKFFQAAMHGETYVTNVYTSVANTQVISIATPIVQDGTISGVLVGTLRLHDNSLAQIFNNKTFGRDGYITVIDKKGTILYHQVKDRIGTKANVTEAANESSGALIRTNSYGQENYVGYSKVPALNWLVTVNTPTSDLAGFRQMLFYQNLLSALAIIALLVTIALYTIRRSTEPIERLITAFTLMRKGKYKKINPTEYAGEFAEMIHVYNSTILMLKEMHTALKENSELDVLTKAYNRRAFNTLAKNLNKEMQLKSVKTVVLIFLDLDFFKQLNDSQGHLAGDTMLCNFTELCQSIAGIESVFRFGGDEFAIILRDVSLKAAHDFAEEIRCQCQQTLSPCTTSIGIASYPQNAITIKDLLEAADKALYISKKSKNKITIA